jgi:hypothetical protein
MPTGDEPAAALGTALSIVVGGIHNEVGWGFPVLLLVLGRSR